MTGFDLRWKGRRQTEAASVSRKLTGEEELKALGHYWKTQNGRSGYKTFITYWLPEQVPGQELAYAYTHWKPGLEMQLFGETIPESPGEADAK